GGSGARLRLGHQCRLPHGHHTRAGQVRTDPRPAADPLAGRAAGRRHGGPRGRPGVIEMPSLSVAEFVRFQYLIEEETGIHLPDSKQPLLVARLSRRLRQLGIASFGDYYDHVVGGPDPHERTVMYDAIS